MIRRCTMEDVPGFVEVVMAAYEDMDYARRFGCEASPGSVASMTRSSINSEDAGIFVVDLGGRIAGAYLVQVVPFTWNFNARVACELVWHMLPGWPVARERREWFVRMLDHMLAWVRGTGAGSLHVNARPDTPAAKLLARRGFRHFENAMTGGWKWAGA